MKKILRVFLSLIISITSFSAPVFAKTSEKQYGCSVSQYPVPEEGKAILLDDYSFEDYSSRGAAIRTNVNRTYSVRIQDTSGSCVSSAQVRVSGYFTYDSTSGNIIETSISATFTSVPTLWTAVIQSQRTLVSGGSVSQSIYYYSKVNDPYSCMVGGGNWYSGATFALK